MSGRVVAEMAKTPEELYAERKKRVLDAAALKVPDRVPMYIPFGVMGARYAGITIQEAFEDMGKWQDINEKLFLEYEPDFFFYLKSFDMVSNEMAGSRYVNWPGHGVGANGSYQFVEGEYMKAEEYDELLNDTGDFILRKYLPRIYGNLGGLSYMLPLMSLLSYGGLFIAFANPAVVAAFETIIKASKQSAQNFMSMLAFGTRMEALGFPLLVGLGGGQAPFDVISDYLRGLRGSTLDMYRCPDKLLAAEQKILSFVNSSSIALSRMMNKPLSFSATHRGSDGFMSLKQFETFYWPGLKASMLAAIEAGITPFMFWEGSWDQRLEYLTELPKGKVVGWFDRTDIFRAKEVLGDRMCICGGMPISLLQVGTPEEIKAYTKKLIDVVGKDGGFIMCANTELDYAKPELVKAWVDFTREYGVYQ